MSSIPVKNNLIAGGSGLPTAEEFLYLGSEIIIDGSSHNEIMLQDGIVNSLLGSVGVTDILERSNEEFLVSIKILESQLSYIDEENNEWKTRHDAQVEINDYYNKSCIETENNLIEAKNFLKDVHNSVKSDTFKTDYADINQNTLDMLEEDIMSLKSLRKEIDWRLEQEAKAYHRANDARKDATVELGFAHVPIGISHSSPRDLYNESLMLNERRMLDPRHGPAKKAAMIRKLPKLKF